MQIAKAAALAAAVLAAGIAGCGGEDPNPPVEPDPAYGAQPNFVFVLTDDQDYASYNRRTMPNTWRLLGRRGSRSPTPTTRRRSAVPRGPRT